MLKHLHRCTRRVAMASVALPLLAKTPKDGSSDGQIQLGCQTNAWAIQPSQPATLFAALADIRELGFKGFETGFANVLPLADKPDELKQYSRGLSEFGVHIFLQHYDAATSVAPSELISKVVAVGAKLGFGRLILSGAPATDENSLNAKAAALNRYGEQAKAVGLKLAYHNHGPEFTGHEPEIEKLLSNTNPSLVWFLLDAGHAFEAGADVVSFLGRHSDRLTGLHLRDYRQGSQVPLGEGDFPLAAVAHVLRKNHWSGWALAEEERLDGTKPGVAAARPAFAALHQAFRV